MNTWLPEIETRGVTFELNARLDLSGGAATKTFSSLVTKPLLQVLGKSTRTVAIWVICGDEGVGDIPGIQGVQGKVCKFCATETRLTQELRLRV